MSTKITKKIKIQNRKASIVFGLIFIGVFTGTYVGSEFILDASKSRSSNELPTGVKSASAPISDASQDTSTLPCNMLAELEAYSYVDDRGIVINVPSGLDLYMDLWYKDQDGSLMIHIQDACEAKISEFNDHHRSY